MNNPVVMFLPEDVSVLLPEVFVEIPVEEGVDDGVGEAAQVQERVDHNLLARDVGQHQVGERVHQKLHQ